MKKAKWVLRIMPKDYWNRHTGWFADDDGEIIIKVFSRAMDAFEYLGFKLKRERCGYGGVDDTFEYCLMREVR